MNEIHGKGDPVIPPESFDLQQLYTFYVAAGSRTFTEASERLHVSQSAVSHAIRKLEQSAGFRLIVRDRSPVRLTDQGQRLYETCGRVFADLRRCREALQQSSGRNLAGRLRIGATVEFGNSILARGAAPFLKRHPRLDVQFTFSHDLVRPLLADELDLIIDCRVHAREELFRTCLFRETYVLVASPALIGSARLREIGDLERVSWLSLDADGEWWQRFLAHLPAGAGVNPRRLLPVNHLRGIIHLAMEGAGVALVPAYCVQAELARGSLRQLFPELHIPEDRFFLYCREYRRNEPAVAAFTRFVKGLRLDQGAASSART